MKGKGKKSISKKIGDKIERFGENIAKKGSSKIGKAMQNAGSKIEHLKDKK